MNYDNTDGNPSGHRDQMMNSSLSSLSHSHDMSESRSEKKIRPENLPQETKQRFEELIHSREKMSEREATGYDDSNSYLTKETTSGPHAPSTFKSDTCQCVSYDISWSDVSTDPESEEEVRNVEDVADELESGSRDTEIALPNDYLEISNVYECENGAGPTAAVQEEISQVDETACGLQSSDQSNVEVSVEHESHLSGDHLDIPNISNCKDGQFLTAKLAFLEGINVDNRSTHKCVPGDNSFFFSK